MRKSYKYRLFTSASQKTALDDILNSARFLYNCALEHRILCYKQWHKSINYYDQANTLKEIRSFDEGIANLNFSASQDILRRLDKAFHAFFRRIKAGDTPPSRPPPAPVNKDSSFKIPRPHITRLPVDRR